MKRAFCIILCLCLVMCLVPPVTAEAADGDFIGGADGDSLKLVYNSANSTILLQARTASGFSNQYYSASAGNSTAIALGFTYNGTYYQYNTTYFGTTAKSGAATLIGAGTAGFTQSQSGNSLILAWSGLGIGSTGGSFNLELSVSYTPGASSFQRGYKVEISFESAYLAKRDSGQQKGHYHGLGPEMMKELPAKLENPILMVKTKRRQNQQYH